MLKNQMPIEPSDAAVSLIFAAMASRTISAVAVETMLNNHVDFESALDLFRWKRLRHVFMFTPSCLALTAPVAAKEPLESSQK